MIDHSPELLGVRDQGRRGTCVAFAVTAVHEHARLRRRAAPSPELSVELLYWRCKQLDGFPGETGTSFSAARDALVTPGQCTEVLWPYDEARDVSSAYAPPPHALRVEGLRRATLRSIPPEIDAMRVALEGGHAVVAGIELWDAFYDCDSDHLAAPDADLDGAGHAVCVVGLDDVRRAIKLRNSWGPHWGEDGYAWLSVDALPTVLWECWIADDDVDAD